MSGSVNALPSLYIGGLSIPQISERTGLNRSRVRKELLSAGVPLRSRTEGVRLRDDLGVARRGIRREPFSDEWKANMSAGRLAWGEEYAKGVSRKASGYVEITRGPNKGRTVHVVAMEERLGRRLLPDEVVHHIDGNPSNNDPNNLALMTRSGHTRHHRMIERIAKCQAR